MIPDLMFYPLLLVAFVWLWLSPFPPTGVAPPRCGGRALQQWRRDSPIIV
jgi:hypothetical protein